MKNEQYYTVSAVVDQACDDIGDFGKHRFAQFLGWALWGARELHFDAGHKVQHAYLTLDEFRMAEYPCDYVDFVSMVIQVGDKVMAIGRARDLAMMNPTDPDTGELIPNASVNLNDSAITGTGTQYYNGMWYWSFPLGGGGLNPGSRLDSGPMPYKGFFDFDNDRRMFRFSSEFNVNAQVALNYISDGFSVNEETWMHPYAVDYLRKYIHEQRLLFTTTAGLGEQQQAARATEFALRLTKRRRDPTTAQDILNTFFRYYSLSNKITNG